MTFVEHAQAQIVGIVVGDLVHVDGIDFKTVKAVPNGVAGGMTAYRRDNERIDKGDVFSVDIVHVVGISILHSIHSVLAGTDSADGESSVGIGLASAFEGTQAEDGVGV